MKANELRIGNLIEYNGSVVEVFSIDKKEFVTFGTNPVIIGKYKYEQSGSIHCTECKPIPLTKEWLKDFGFEFNKNGLYIIDICEIYDLDLLIIGSELCTYYTNKHNDSSHSLKRINSVHQLQNLYFALTNEELTIKTK